MVLRFLIMLLAVMPMTPSLQAGWFDNVTNFFNKKQPALPPKIRVLVVHDETGVVLEVKGKYKVYDPHSGEHISTRFVGKRKFIQAVRDGLKWGEEFPGVHQLLIVPDDSATTTIVDGIEYRGLIYVYDIGGTISIVNEVLIEDFLASTLPHQYQESMSEEAMAAIAIAARTAAYYRIENPKSQYFSVDGRQAGYQGYAAMLPSSPITQAIRATRYMVMSTSAPNEDQLRPFLAVWKQSGEAMTSQDVISRITVQEVQELADQGAHAAQILTKAYPGIKIELIHYAAEKPVTAQR